MSSKVSANNLYASSTDDHNCVIMDTQNTPHKGATMTQQDIKTNVTVFGPDEQARFTIHAAKCKAAIMWGHLEAVTIPVWNRKDVVADVYAFLNDEDQASALNSDFDFCSCLKSLPTKSAKEVYEDAAEAQRIQAVRLQAVLTAAGIDKAEIKKARMLMADAVWNASLAYSNYTNILLDLLEESLHND